MKKETTFNHRRIEPAQVASLLSWVGMTEEEVRGIIIEVPEPKKLYKFYMEVAGVPHQIDRGWFLNDADAEAYVRNTHPRAYARGIEMRVFDR